jgi:DNA replication and repair protein RecF
MKLASLTLRNFRNFIDTEINTLDGGLMVAAAPNATGKTNFLEAVVMALRGRSWRASHSECVRWGEDAFIVQSEVARSEGSSSLAVRYHIPTKKMRIEEDGKPVSSVTFYKRYPLVLFVAEDTFLFTRSPAQRRNFLNQVLVTAPPYVSSLVQYQRALLQRNTALKQAQDFSYIASWTELVVEHGVVLWRYRQQLVDYVNANLVDMYEQVSGETLKLKAELVTTTDDPSQFQKQLARTFTSEQRLGYTLKGPHRDDVIVTSNGKPGSAVLSQGQMRSVVLALKLVTASFIEVFTNEKPLVLLDEALSELDTKRQKRMLANLPTMQTLLTCTSLPATLVNQDNVQLLDLRSILQRSVIKQEKKREPSYGVSQSKVAVKQG